MTLIQPEVGISIIPGKLFLHCFHQKPRDTISDHYFLFDEIQSIVFDPLSRENGPSTLPNIFHFINLMKEKLNKINKQIHICCSLGSISRVNCIYMICLFLILEKDYVMQVIKQQANKTYPSKYSKPKPRPLPNVDDPLTLFDDVYPKIEEYEDAIASPFTISIRDALNGFIRGTKNGWFDMGTFNSDEYNFYIAPENGFMTWVVPKRLLVLSAPGYADSPPLFDMLPLFRKWRIRTIVNFASESRGFEDLVRVGIEYFTLDCAHDSLPSLSEVKQFCEICDKGDAVAICSMNGLGRGPMFAALWLVNTYGFPPKEAIGWVRSVRQGSIYGVQHEFIMRYERSIHPQQTVLTVAKNSPRSKSRSVTSRLATTGRMVANMKR